MRRECGQHAIGGLSPAPQLREALVPAIVQQSRRRAERHSNAAMVEAGSLLLGAAALVLGYVLLSILRAVLFPPKVQPPEYKAKQVRLGCGLAQRPSESWIAQSGGKTLMRRAMARSATSAAAAAAAAAACSLPRRAPTPRPARLPHPPTQIGPLTLLELSKYDGRDPMRPLLLAVRGRVYDVTPGRAFYGPGALRLLARLPACNAAAVKSRLRAL